MSKSRPLSNQLRTAIKNAAVSRYRISKETGIPQGMEQAIGSLQITPRAHLIGKTILLTRQHLMRVGRDIAAI